MTTRHTRPAWFRSMSRRLVEARGCAGYQGRALTRAELARAAGLDTRMVWRYENGGVAPSLFAFRELALALGVSADGLLGLGECGECGRTVEAVNASRHCED